jgi:hypothetical protein
VWLTPLNLLNSRGKKFRRRLNRGTKDTEYPEDELSLVDAAPELLPIRNERSACGGEKKKIIKRRLLSELLGFLTAPSSGILNTRKHNVLKN